MFGLYDILYLMVSIFIILPIVSMIHEIGHLFFAVLFKAKNQTLDIGCGKPILQIGRLCFRKYYFFYSWCQFERLEKNTRFHYILVYAGPMIFNILAAIGVNALIYYDLIEGQKFWNLFVYYSIYFVMFDAIPMRYPDGQPSNGLVVFEMLKDGKRATFQKEKWAEEELNC
ncbi:MULTISPECIES: site-2 protease family protein [Pontibacillus]|uniref:Peptidase M50 domain-containing protein n=1 Tax=Pontibacillus chungwhensis TaxID=265426 RepID=A0ABY8V0J2_9BACI|nr:MULTISPECIES: site-2 protease family protein [Pontibacillus]MCD5325596.1 hypothetical protein [Pontibacillus sp. HN14]WIF98155.1 hypothetical protein QNI29_00095 [Pontibacillus chungwhensis]